MVVDNFLYLCALYHGTIAQLVEQRTENPCVPGSNPGGTTKKTGCCHPVFLFLHLRMKNITLIEGLADLDQYLIGQGFSQCLILVDSNTREHCLSALVGSSDSLSRSEVIEVEPGESSKSAEIVAGIWNAMIDLHADRQTCLICLGGGMITDLGGFVASTFKRGIPYIYVPTTLLAMVDAAIGGKTGINIGHYKNQAGTFASPAAIVQDPSWLSSLPHRELRSGFAEMIKHGLIADGTHLNELLKIEEVTLENTTSYIRRSAEIKETIVAQDPNETGIRKVLNFGHTAGHAFEALSHVNNAPLLHGEAIAIGMHLALGLSVEHSGLAEKRAIEVMSYLTKQFAIDFTELRKQFPTGDLWSFMLADKKNHQGEVRFVLLKSFGTPLIDCAVSMEDFDAIYQAAR